MSKVLVICGATASGKTALSVACAKAFNGEIISADSLLVYKGLNIGTAKPTMDERAGVPHYMIDVVEPTESFSVSDYEEMALPIVERLLSEGKTPIICGGTGFYINSLLYKSQFGNVGANEELRAEYERLAEEKGLIVMVGFCFRYPRLCFSKGDGSFRRRKGRSTLPPCR